MEQIFCKYCGAEYSASEMKCPLCGASNAPHVADDFDFLDDDFEVAAKPAAPEMPVAPSVIPNGEPAEEKNAEPVPAAMPPYEKAAESADRQKKRKTSNAGAVISVILCVVVIIGLLVAIFFVARATGLLDHVLDGKLAEQPDEDDSLALPVEDPDVHCAGITLDITAVTLTEEGATQKLVATAQPEGCTDKVNWISSYPEIATVDDAGVVTAVTEGNVNILVTCGDYAASCMVTVDFSGAEDAGEEPKAGETDEEGLKETEGAEEEDQPEEPEDTTMRINYTDVTLSNPGEKLQLAIKNLPEGETVTWTTDNDVIAEVDEDGMVTATATGTCNVTAQVGEEKFTCIVRCNLGTEPGVKITAGLNQTDITLFYEGEQFRLKVTYPDETTEVGECKWSTSDEEICTVDDRGTVTAVAKGTATVTVEVDGVALKCTVRVNIEEETEAEEG